MAALIDTDVLVHRVDPRVPAKPEAATRLLRDRLASQSSGCRTRRSSSSSRPSRAPCQEGDRCWMESADAEPRGSARGTTRVDVAHPSASPPARNSRVRSRTHHRAAAHPPLEGRVAPHPRPAGVPRPLRGGDRARRDEPPQPREAPGHVRVCRVPRAALPRRGEVRERHRVAELLRADPGRARDPARLQALLAAHRVPLRTLRRAPGARVRRRPRADGAALLQQRRRAWRPVTPLTPARRAATSLGRSARGRGRARAWRSPRAPRCTRP